MKNLVLLRGAPGSGKSTFIKNNGLSDWTVCVDDIRILFQSPVTTIYGGKEISQKNDNKVWDFLYTIVEERMKRGEFVIIDATHSRSQWLTKYRELVERYRYRVFAVEFMPPLEQVLFQNSSRPVLKQVPEEYIKKSYEFIKTDKLQGWIKTISQEDFIDMFSPMKTFDFNNYNKIHHIGDLHGCYEPFKEYYDLVGGLKDDEMWIFVGDYIDRGIQNGKLLRFLIENFMGKKNVLFLEGNHEKWLRYWSHGEVDNIRSKEFVYKTAPDISRENIEMGQIREFTRRLAQIAWYEFDDKKVFVNHSGHPLPPAILTTSDEYINGVGKYEDILSVQNTWNKHTSENCYQVHGHRNMEKNPIVNGRCFNLTEDIEIGGNLRVATLDKDGWCEYLLKNTIFRENQKEIPELKNAEDKPIIQKLIDDKNVVKKNLGNGVVSFNFSRDVFYDKKWNDVTTKARGLFVNINIGKVVARSWEKFFNIEERDETKYTSLKRSMTFPAIVYKKENGFLGLIGYNPENDELFISSKSTNDGEFVEYFKEVISYTNLNLDVAKDICKHYGVTLVFEVIHPEKDAHIIEYDKKSLFLLSATKNEFEYSSLPYSEMIQFSKALGVSVKEKIITLNNWMEFSDWYAQIENNYEHKWLEEYVEGYVVESSNGFMFKIKTEYYKFWKKMRTVSEKLAKGQLYNTSWLQSPEEVRTYAKIKDLGRSNLEGKSIIQIRKMIE